MREDICKQKLTVYKIVHEVFWINKEKTTQLKNGVLRYNSEI